MQELTQTLQSLKNQREVINKDIENGEMMKMKIQDKLNSFMDELERINQSLEQKTQVLSVYDKILSDSDSAYNKIVQSTEALYNMVKNEEKKVTMNRQGYTSTFNNNNL
jgi:Sjoegren syndrome nuclear autoantigen 1